MKKIFNNVIISLLVVVIVLFLMIPLPPALLDVLIIVNISISIMILLITMNISEALQFSIFPSLLLITTLFRLGLNVSSTRLILTNGGFAGNVIASFGNMITQGNIVVGVLIFLIIVLVQFIVITKGAERVAEVAARFTLDAMPGKQMAIDADLSSGLISEQEARERRHKIQKEADFYGAMDGATKIVKGDAVMSLIITFINFVAGLIIGMVQGGGDSGYRSFHVFHRHHRRRPGLPAARPADLHGHRHDRHPFGVGRQFEHRRAQAVFRPAPGHHGHRRSAGVSGADARYTQSRPDRHSGGPGGLGSLCGEKGRKAGKAGPGPGNRGGSGSAGGKTAGGKKTITKTSTTYTLC